MAWEEVNIGEIVENLDGKRIPLKSADRKKMTSKKYPYYGASGIIDNVDEYIFDGEYLLLSEDGANLLARSSPIAFLATGKFWVNNHEHVLLAKNGITTNKYLEYYFNSINISSYVSGSAQPKLNQKNLNRIKIPLPPLPIQKKIAAILDAADKYRQKTKALIDKYDQLTQSIFLEMFGDPVMNEKGWEKVNGSELYEVRGRVGWKGYKKTDLRTEGAIVLGATHVERNGTINLEKIVYLSKEKYLESPEIMVLKNDLIFVQRGNTVGKVGLVRNDLGEVTINPVVLILRPVNVNPLFLLNLLMNKRQRKELEDSNQGAAQPMITQKTMKTVSLINIPIDLQNLFVKKIAFVENQRNQLIDTINHSENLFQSLLQKVFKGELTK